MECLRSRCSIQSAQHTRLAIHGQDHACSRRHGRLEGDNYGRPSASLNWIAAYLPVPGPDPAYQAHTNWSSGVLSQRHQAYASEAVRLPLKVLQVLFPEADINQVHRLSTERFPWYQPYAAALVRLAEAHVRGVPYDTDSAERLVATLSVDLSATVDELMHYTEFRVCREELLDIDIGETSRQRAAEAAYVGNARAATNKCDSQLDHLPGCALIRKIWKNKSEQRRIQQYSRAAAADGRLHPLTTCSAATGRSISNKPTVQNIPRDIRFRKLIKARPGHLILSVDYSAIELRIASVLADRSIAEIRWRIENQKLENCFLIQARRGMLAPELLPLDPTDGVHDSLDMVAAVAQRVLIREPQSMSMVFLRGLDPHLVTAADMARRQGRLAFEGNPIEWIATLTSDARRDCRIELEVERQKAKAANFGLL